MTEILLNNLNNLNNLKTDSMDKLIHSKDKFIAADKHSDFDKVVKTKADKLDKKDGIEGVKNRHTKGGMSDKLANFKEILSQTVSEVNVENSLNLTLARDIGEIISQLRGAAETASPDINKEDADKYDIQEAVIEKIQDEVVEEIEFDNILTGAETVLTQGFAHQFDSVEAAAEYEEQQPEKIIENEGSDIDVKTKVLDEARSELSSVIDEEMLEDLNIESISAETNNENAKDSMMNNQSPEEHGVKVMLNQTGEKFDINMVKSPDSLAHAKALDMTPEKIIEQITKQLDSFKANSKVNIVLNPESLGKVDLQIINTKEGLSAQFTVTTNEARELLMKGLDGLKESLLAQGVGVDNISVKITETEEASYNQDWTEQEGSRGGNKDNGEPNKQEKEKGLFEKTMAQNLKENGKV